VSQVEAIRTNRTNELVELQQEVAAAIDRLKLARVGRPEVATPRPQYWDGSGRTNINGLGGIMKPLHHVWKVGRVDDLDVYIYELIDWDVFNADRLALDFVKMDIGEYELAVSNPSVSMDRYQGHFVASVPERKFAQIDWELDTIRGVSQLLRTFYQPADIAARIAR